MQILTGITPFVTVFVVLAVAAALTGLGVVADFLVRNRSERLRAGTPLVPHYRAALALAR